MKKILLRLWITCFGGTIKLIEMGESKQKTIMRQVSEIEGIDAYFELQIQAGYVLFGRTRDERYLGIVDNAQSILKQIQEMRKSEPAEENRQERGYDSTV